MNASLSSIDLGFLYTKSIINNKYIITKSVVGEGYELEFADLSLMSEEAKRQKDNIQLSLNGNKKFISDLAIDESSTIYHSLKSDRFNGDVIESLVKTAFGIGFGYGSHSTYVVSGLPASQYAKFKDSIKSLFMGAGQHTHTYNVTWDRVMGMTTMEVHSKPQNAMGTVRTIQGQFLPQPHAAGLDRLLEDDGSIADKVLAGKTIAVIDPGFGTSDIYVLSALSPVQRLSFSIDTAMNTAYRLIGDKIKERFGVDLPFYKIDYVVRTKVFIKDGKEADMTNVINWALKATAQQLVAEIYNRWKNTHEIDHIFVAGGGGAALYPYIMQEFASIELIANSQWAIARGYNKWGRRTWKNELAYV